MNGNIQSVSLTSAGGINGQAVPLRDGGNVMVRVLQDKGNGNYLVSFAGNRFNVRSESALKPGQTFVAQMNFKDGKVFLTPQGQTSSIQAEKMLASVMEDGSPNAVLAHILADFGLVPDAVTVKLMQFLQQGNFQMDKSLMQKARIIALNFPGKEKKAAEIAATLMEKGLKADIQTVRKFLLMLEGEGFSNQGGNSQSNKDSESPDKKDKKSSEKNAKILLEKLFGKIPENDGGLLTLLNQTGENSDLHWILLPYKWNLKRKNGTSSETEGFIRLLINKALKTVEKINVSCKVPDEKGQWTNYFFVLYLNLSKVKEMRFCTLPALLTSQISLQEKRFGELLRSGMNADDSVTVTYSSLAFTDGLFADSEIPVTFDNTI